MINSRYARIAGASIVCLLVVGSIRSLNKQVPQISKDDILALAEIQLTGGDPDEQTATASAESLDQSIVALNAKFSRAHELAIADLEAMICARAGQYLISAAEQSAQGFDESTWLRAQLKLENQAIKESLSSHSTLSGSAHHMSQSIGPLVNRAAITKAVLDTQEGEITTCRVSPYDSAIAVEQAVFAGDAMRENQRRWAKEEVASGE